MKIYHGNILTCDDNNSTYQYLAEENGIITYVGNDFPYHIKGAQVIELGKQALLPSFVDTHIHFASMALFHSGMNAMAITSNDELKERLAMALPKSKAKVLLAFGASPHSVKEKALVSREDLDEVSDSRPIMIVKYDGHACIVNTALLKQLPKRVKTLRGYNPSSGEMKQEAFFATTDYVSSTVSIWALVKSMQKAIDYMASKGIGMIHTVSGVGFPKDIDVDLERYVGCGLIDGCFGSMDAALTATYEGTENKGVLYYSDEEITQFCIKANRLGLQIELHAIGDRAFDQAAAAIKAALEDYPREDHRHGIIHA